LVGWWSLPLVGRRSLPLSGRWAVSLPGRRAVPRTRLHLLQLAAFVRVRCAPFGRIPCRRWPRIGFTARRRPIFRTLRRSSITLALRRRTLFAITRRRPLLAIARRRPVWPARRWAIIVRWVVAAAERDRRADERSRCQCQSHDCCPHLERSPSIPESRGNALTEATFRRATPPSGAVRQKNVNRQDAKAPGSWQQGWL
jgi:hypothetical protein